METKMISGISRQISGRLKAGVLILFILIGFKYILMPVIDWQKDIVNRAISLQQSVDRKKSLIGLEGQVEKVLQDSIILREQWCQHFETNLPDPQTWQLKLQKQMEELTQKLNITTSNVDWLPLVKGRVIGAPIKFRVKTTPENFMKLIYALENASHFIAIERINISTRRRSDTFIAELDVSAYGFSEALSNQ